MKVQDLLEELEDNDFFKKFKSENPSAFFSAGFFIMNLKEKSETIQLDFFLPKQNKIVAFEHPFKEPKIFNEEIKKMQPQRAMSPARTRRHTQAPLQNRVIFGAHLQLQ